ncbi:ATP-dependent RNA helicase DDX55 [Bienertia sinuspersici]
MSRCFPFPPPGYVRKTKADDTDLLKKEKHKEKKHKKEKKDKDKKEGKEKREKERSDEKHREKKDKKERHRDKKKDKDKDRDKDKHKNDLLLSDDKKGVGSAADSHVHKPSEKIKERENDRNVASAEKISGSLSAVHNGMPVSKNNHQISENRNFKHVPDSGRRSMDEERRTTNHLPDKNVSAVGNKDGGVVKLATNTGGPLQDSKETTKEKRAVDGKIDGRSVIGDARSSGNALVPNSVGVFQNKVGDVRSSEKKIQHKVDGKEKVREREGDNRKRDKRKEKDREKSVLKDKEKKKKEEIMKTTAEKQIQVPRMKNGSDNHILKPNANDGDKKDFSGVQSVGPHSMAKDSNHHAATVNSNPRKRKDFGLNELVTGPNIKMARTTASPHPFSENGRSLEPCQNSAASAPGITQPPMDTKVDRNLSFDDSQNPPMKIKVDGKDCKINGTIANPFTQSSREHTAKAERKSDAPAKPPPHPDTKYLDQVLSVPKLDELSDFEDQEWLFSSNSSLTRKLEVESSGNDEIPQVWARAMWLEPVDVYALPYVIPH